MNTVALVLALAVLLTGLAAAAIVRLLPTLRLQLVAVALLAVCFPLGVVLASGLVMFGMHDSAKVVAVAVVVPPTAAAPAPLPRRRGPRPPRPLLPAPVRPPGRGAERQPRSVARPRGSARADRAGQDRTRSPEPARERCSSCQGRRSRFCTGGAEFRPRGRGRRGQRRRTRAGGAAADVRALLA